MRCFTVYRDGDLSATHDANQANAPSEPQYEGVVFTNGKVAQRWLTPIGSTCVWDSFDDMWKIHGHANDDRYRTRVVWHDGGVAGP